MKKEKIYKLMYIITSILIIGFILTLCFDIYNIFSKHHIDNIKLTVYILIRTIEFIIPSVICLLIGNYLEKDLKFKDNKKTKNENNKKKIKKNMF